MNLLSLFIFFLSSLRESTGQYLLFYTSLQNLGGYFQPFQKPPACPPFSTFKSKLPDDMYLSLHLSFFLRLIYFLETIFEACKMRDFHILYLGTESGRCCCVAKHLNISIRTIVAHSATQLTMYLRCWPSWFEGLRCWCLDFHIAYLESFFANYIHHDAFYYLISPFS